MKHTKKAHCTGHYVMKELSALLVIYEGNHRSPTNTIFVKICTILRQWKRDTNVTLIIYIFQSMYVYNWLWLNKCNSLNIRNSVHWVTPFCHFVSVMILLSGDRSQMLHDAITNYCMMDTLEVVGSFSWRQSETTHFYRFHYVYSIFTHSTTRENRGTLVCVWCQTISSKSIDCNSRECLPNHCCMWLFW